MSYPPWIKMVNYYWRVWDATKLEMNWAGAMSCEKNGPGRNSCPIPFAASTLVWLHNDHLLRSPLNITQECSWRGLCFSLFSNAEWCFYNVHCKRIGESLFTLFASLTYAYHYLMTLIKQKLWILKGHNSLSFLWKFESNSSNGFGEILF